MYLEREKVKSFKNLLSKSTRDVVNALYTPDPLSMSIPQVIQI